MTVECALQVRAQIRYGTSVFTRVFAVTGKTIGEKLYAHDDSIGQLTLSPNIKMKARQITYVTNDLGLRSPPIQKTKHPDEFRFVVLGASTVMGAYAKSNKDTFSYMLAEILRKERPQMGITFINGGIAGYNVAKQRNLFNGKLIEYSPDLVIIYTGVNDFSRFCEKRTGADGANEAHRLPRVVLPKWVLTYELITKNSQWSKPPYWSPRWIPLEEISASPIEQDLKLLVDDVGNSGARMILISSAKAYRKDMPADEQNRLAELSMYYYPCLDLTRLYRAYEEFDSFMRSLSDGTLVQYLDAEAVVPGGSQYFADPVHFTKHGEELLAKSLAKLIIATHLPE